MAGRRRRPSKSNRRGMAAIAVVVLVLLVTLMVQSQKLKDSNQQYESQKAELEQQIRDEELRTGEIENLKDYVNSKEYIEKIAREKLGLVYEDDIIFKAEG
ncbi:MAG: septum formation initiator family protein [Candidatus Choladocola sp.]|nr:septum formation initiator family protein [Candidatus Choladocola sp.]